MRDPYEVLGVSRDASGEEIRRAYRRKAREHHPDLNEGDKESEARFKQLSKAYETLSDPRKRRNSDLYGDANGRAPAGGDFGDFASPFGDIFDIFFGRGRREGEWASRRGSDLEYRLALTLEESFKGAEKTIEIPRHSQCRDCGGSGLEPGFDLDLCPDCGGEGRINTSHQTLLGSFNSTVTCRRCGGAGGINSHPCRACGGEGRRFSNEEIELKIPAGVDTGDRMRVAGKGEGGLRGGPPGDLYVVMQLEEHPYFERRERDLRGWIRLSLSEAVLGTEVEVELLDGREKVRLGPGTQPGQVILMRKRGMPVLHSRRRGDLYLEVEVEVPSGLTAEEKRLFKELQRLQGGRGKSRAGLAERRREKD